MEKEEADKMVHEYDVNMIDDVKGEALKLYNKIDSLEEELNDAEEYADEVWRQNCDLRDKIKELEDK